MIYLGDKQVGLNSSQDGGAVLYTEEQGLTDIQKERARNNIAAVGNEELGELKSQFDNALKMPLSDAGYWEQGAISQTDGSDVGSEYRIRNSVYFDGDKYYGFEIPSGYEVTINAWDENEYVGTLKSDGTFSTGTTNMVWVTEYSFSNYSNYKYRLTMRSKSGAKINSSAGSACVFYKTSAIEQQTHPNRITSFYDGAYNAPFEKLITSIKPLQDLHGFDFPWPGGWYINMIPDGTDTSNGYVDGAYLKEDGTTGSNANNVISEFFPVIEGNTYTWGVGAGVASTTYNASAVCFYDSNKNYISGIAMGRIVSHQITAPSGASYARSTQMIGEGMEKLQFERGTTAHKWMPYANECPISGQTGCNINISPSFDPAVGKEYNVDWESVAGTVYGGSYDIKSGLLKSEYYNWILGAATNPHTIYVSGNHIRFRVTTSHGIFYGGYRYSDKLRQGIHGTGDDFTWGTIADDPKQIYIWLPYNVPGGVQEATANGIKSWLIEHPIQIVATIDNPTSYTLSSVDIRTLYGENHITIETASITECEYRSDARSVANTVAKIPVGMKKYSYRGDRVNIQNQCAVEYLYTLTDQHPIIQDGVNRTRQGGTAFGDYLFVAYNGMETLDVIDLLTGRWLYTITLSENYLTNYHCNNINFGWERYDPTDEFPLLYISANHVDGICLVYRIQRNASAFTATLVQTIGIPPLIEGGGTNTRFAFVDSDNHYLYVEGHTTGSTTAAPDNYHRFCKYNLPKLSDGDVNLTLTDMIDYFDIPSVTAYQGGITMMGRFYQVYGWGSSSDFQQVDLWSKRLATYINLWDMGITDEPEACFIWRNHLCLYTVLGHVYRLHFD